VKWEGGRGSSPKPHVYHGGGRGRGFLLPPLFLLAHRTQEMYGKVLHGCPTKGIRASRAPLPQHLSVLTVGGGTTVRCVSGAMGEVSEWWNSEQKTPSTRHTLN